MSREQFNNLMCKAVSLAVDQHDDEFIKLLWRQKKGSMPENKWFLYVISMYGLQRAHAANEKKLYLVARRCFEEFETRYSEVKSFGNKSLNIQFLESFDRALTKAVGIGASHSDDTILGNILEIVDSMVFYYDRVHDRYLNIAVGEGLFKEDVAERKANKKTVIDIMTREIFGKKQAVFKEIQDIVSDNIKFSKYKELISRKLELIDDQEERCVDIINAFSTLFCEFDNYYNNVELPALTESQFNSWLVSIEPDSYYLVPILTQLKTLFLDATQYGYDQVSSVLNYETLLEGLARGTDEHEELIRSKLNGFIADSNFWCTDVIDQSSGDTLLHLVARSGNYNLLEWMLTRPSLLQRIREAKYSVLSPSLISRLSSVLPKTAESLQETVESYSSDQENGHVSYGAHYRFCTPNKAGEMFFDVQDTHGNTPLHGFMSCGKEQLALVLVERGADPMIANHKGVRACEILSAVSYPPENGGNTLAHAALKNNMLQIANKLVINPLFDIGIKDARGVSVWDYIVAKNQDGQYRYPLNEQLRTNLINTISACFITKLHQNPDYEEVESDIKSVVRSAAAKSDEVPTTIVSALEGFQPLKVARTKGSGLVSAISMYLNKPEPDVRKMVVRYIQDQKRRFHQQPMESSGFPFAGGSEEDFIKQVNEGEERGSQQELAFFQRCFGAPIVVVREGQNIAPVEGYDHHVGEPIFVCVDAEGFYHGLCKQLGVGDGWEVLNKILRGLEQGYQYIFDDSMFEKGFFSPVAIKSIVTRSKSLESMGGEGASARHWSSFEVGFDGLVERGRSQSPPKNLGFVRRVIRSGYFLKSSYDSHRNQYNADIDGMTFLVVDAHARQDDRELLRHIEEENIGRIALTDSQREEAGLQANFAKGVVEFGHQTFFGHLAYALEEERQRSERERSEKERERSEKERERSEKERVRREKDRLLEWVKAQGLSYEEREEEAASDGAGAAVSGVVEADEAASEASAAEEHDDKARSSIGLFNS